jgi:predicted CXXCH cytochrome family protein
MKEAVEGSNHEFFKNGKCLKCHDVHGSNIPGMIVPGDDRCKTGVSLLFMPLH